MTKRSAAERIGPVYAACMDMGKLDKEEEYELLRRAKGGDADAADVIARASAPCMLRFALRHLSWAFGGTLQLDDIMATGAEILPRAIDRFDFGHDVRFSAFLGACMKRELQRRIQGMRNGCRLPENAAAQRHRLMQALTRSREQGKTYDLAQAAEDAGISAERAHDLLHAPNAEPDSLDAPSGPDRESDSLHSHVADPDAVDQLEAARIACRRRCLNRALHKLPTETDRVIVIKMYIEESGAADAAAELDRMGMPLSPNKIRDRAARNLRRLKRLLREDPAFTPDD